jgi:hypothetical protein
MASCRRKLHAVTQCYEIGRAAEIWQGSALSLPKLAHIAAAGNGGTARQRTPADELAGLEAGTYILCEAEEAALGISCAAPIGLHGHLGKSTHSCFFAFATIARGASPMLPIRFEFITKENYLKS